MQEIILGIKVGYEVKNHIIQDCDRNKKIFDIAAMLLDQFVDEYYSKNG